MRDGFGNKFYKNGDKYSGNWEMDNKSGKGDYDYANGDK